MRNEGELRMKGDIRRGLQRGVFCRDRRGVAESGGVDKASKAMESSVIAADLIDSQMQSPVFVFFEILTVLLV